MSWLKKLMIPVLILGMVGIADAKGKKSGLKGKITIINGKDITISKGKKNGGQTTLIHTTATTSITIDGVGGKAVTDLQVGEKVVVTPAGGTATQIIATTKHKKKKTA